MDLITFSLNIIKTNFPKLIGKKVYVCDLDFKLTDYLSNDDLKKYKLEDIINCVDEIVSETSFVQDNWDNCVLIDDKIAKKFINEIEKNNLRIF